MTVLRALDDLRWRTIPFALARLSVPIEVLASQLGFVVRHWEEDGLGPVGSLEICLPSGRPVLLQEHAHIIEQGDASGPDVLVDADDIAATGVLVLLSEVLDALHLTSNSVVWLQDPEARATAAAQARFAEAYLANRAP